MKRRPLFILLAAIGLAMSPSCGQTPAPQAAAETAEGTGVTAPAVPAPGKPVQLPSLPELAVEATRLGLEAASRQDWSGAIRHFREARSAAPEDPAVLFRLALAHDRAGHGLPAIAWFQAFLAVAPQAKNAPLVRERITQLEKANQEQAYRLVALVDQKFAKNWDSEGFAGFLAKAGRPKEAEKLIGARLFNASMFEAIAKGLCEAGDYQAAREIAGRFPENNERRKALMWETIESQARQGDVQGALKFAKASDLSAVRLAVPLAQEGRAIETVDLLYDATLDDLLTPEMQFALANTLLNAASLSPGGSARFAIDSFFERHGSKYKCAIAVAKALAEWGYVAEAEMAASLIEEVNWRFLADLDILKSKAALREIGREQHVREIERCLKSVTDVEVKDRGYLALVHAQLAIDDLKGAEETASRIKDSGLYGGSDFNLFLPMGGMNTNSARARRVLFPVQALHGDISKAESTAKSSRWHFGHNDKSIEAFFEALKPGGGELGKIILTVEQYSVQEIIRVGGAYSLDHDLLHQAVVFHSQRDDIEAARNVARFHKGLNKSDSFTNARSHLVMAAALARLGRHAESKKVFAEALESVGGEAYELADDFAKDDNVEGLRAIVRQTWENSAGRMLPAVFHKLSRLQRSIGDAEGAEQTLRMSAAYSPRAEAADWSATALRLEKRDVCVTSAREYLTSQLSHPVMNTGSFRANQLLDIQFDLRDRAARWQRRKDAPNIILPISN